MQMVAHPARGAIVQAIAGRLYHVQVLPLGLTCASLPWSLLGLNSPCLRRRASLQHSCRRFAPSPLQWQTQGPCCCWQAGRAASPATRPEASQLQVLC